MPPNVIPYLLIGVATVFFGIKAIIYYKKSRNTISLYFGISGILIGIGTLFNSVPYVFTNQENALKICILIGDSFLYASILVQTRLHWYYNNQNTPFWVYFAPVFALIAFIEVVYVVTLPANSFTYVNNIAYVPVNPVVAWLSAAACLMFVATGLQTVVRAARLNSGRLKIRLFIIGLAFILGGLIASYNYAILQGVNNDFTIVGYTAAVGLLLIAVLVLTRKKFQK